MKSVGFKEWSIVCDAMGSGQQTIILRKGGIAEGREGFSFRHREFYLFPTFFHEQLEKVRGVFSRLIEPADQIVIRLHARVEGSARIESLEVAEQLAPLHILLPEAVRERFYYKAGGLDVVFVRVFRLEQPRTLQNEKRFGGCRSWVDLPLPPAATAHPVLSDRASNELHARFDQIVGRSGPLKIAN